MINLIPNEEKKKRVRDFYFRLVVVFFFVLGFAMLVAVVALLPSYFLSTIREYVATDKLKDLQAQPEPVTNPNTPGIIKDVENKIALIEKSEKAKYLLSEKIVNEIVLHKMSDIKINNISFKSDVTTGKSVSIRGIAPSRERLLLFRRTLEDNVAFKKVDLPISNFIKGSNISFSLTLTPS
jgi:hypothetical protein